MPLVDHEQSDLSRQITTALKTTAGLEIEDTFLQGGLPRAMTEVQARQHLEAHPRATAILIPQEIGGDIRAARPMV